MSRLRQSSKPSAEDLSSFMSAEQTIHARAASRSDVDEMYYDRELGIGYIFTSFLFATSQCV